MRPAGARLHADELDDLTLARAQRGDAAAFRALVGWYQQPVYAYLFRMLIYRMGNDLETEVAAKLTPERARQIRKPYNPWPGLRYDDTGCEERGH